jgi:hypothetical protein
VEAAVDFMYSGELQLNSKNEAEAMLQFATSFQIDQLREKAAEFLDSFLTVAIADGTCSREMLLELHLLARNHNLHRFGMRCWTLLEEQSREQIRSPSAVLQHLAETYNHYAPKPDGQYSATQGSSNGSDNQGTGGHSAKDVITEWADRLSHYDHASQKLLLLKQQHHHQQHQHNQGHGTLPSPPPQPISMHAQSVSPPPPPPNALQASLIAMNAELQQKQGAPEVQEEAPDSSSEDEGSEEEESEEEESEDEESEDESEEDESSSQAEDEEVSGDDGAWES